MKVITPQFNSAHYVAPYSHNRLTIHDRRQSAMSGCSSSPEARTRQDYAATVVNTAGVSQAPGSAGAWTSAQPTLQDNDAKHLLSYPPTQPNLPPLSEALHGLDSDTVVPVTGPSSVKVEQPAISTVNPIVPSPTLYQTPAAYLEIQPPAPVNVYSSQTPFVSDTARMSTPQGRDSSPHAMVPTDPNAAAAAVATANFGRRVTYPFVPPLETNTGLMMANSIPRAETGSSPLGSTAYHHGGLASAGATVPIQGMPRVTAVGYMDSLVLQQQHPVHAPYPLPSQSSGQQSLEIPSVGWPSQNGGFSTVSESGGSHCNGKVYSFVPLSGVNTKKRPRRRFDEIERLYVCSWGDCEKSYGTLNHLNAHVNMQKHGPKRLPAEFKELRKAWRRHKKAEEEAAKQAAVAFQQQQQTQSQTQAHLALCDPVLSHMHPTHALAMHPMTAAVTAASISQHQPAHLPHPHIHPNHTHHHTSVQPYPSQSQHHHHHHPMGF
ncbi:hypothetical protein BGW38_007071 [Lunasporangiospora selenospora]|uniref:C2H2-type domain-containing protein n=1 Tax=Lunasporangiospora selenospora TaxID=979761 RepID=A0A9P6KAL0_9FUNG|nr:hypothetical protein BGW38_007071 [Lunasporangiospora selenospora]